MIWGWSVMKVGFTHVSSMKWPTSCITRAAHTTSAMGQGNLKHNDGRRLPGKCNFKLLSILERT